MNLSPAFQPGKVSHVARFMINMPETKFYASDAFVS